MKILHLPSWYPYPAQPYAGRFFVDQANAIARHTGHEVFLLNWGQNEYQLKLKQPLGSIRKTMRYLSAKPQTRELADRLTEITLPHLSWTSKVLNGNLNSLATQTQRIPKPDLIHAQVSYPAGYLAYRLSQVWNIPFIITEHSGPFPFNEFITAQGISDQITVPLRKAKRVIAVSSFLKTEIERQIPVTCQVIPNLVDTLFYQPSPKPTNNKRFRLFCLTQFTLAKGITDLISALRIAVEKGSQAELYLGGDGELTKNLRNYIANNGLSRHVRLLGRLDAQQALQQYQSCDCYLMPSRIESFSMVLLEAMACGKPVIATDCGGPADIVTPATGILIPKQRPEKMAEAILRLEKEYRDYDAEKIRESCAERFSPRVICEKLSELYEDVLKI